MVRVLVREQKLSVEGCDGGAKFPSDSAEGGSTIA